MLFFFITLILYVIPLAIGIVLIRYFLRRKRLFEVARTFTTSTLAVLSICFLSINSYVYLSRFHSTDFRVNNHSICYVNAFEQEGFLDVSYDFEIELYNEQTGDRNHIEFTTLDGSEMVFLTSKDYPNVIMIRGKGKNFFIKLLPEQLGISPLSISSTFKSIASLSYDFNLVKSSFLHN